MMRKESMGTIAVLVGTHGEEMEVGGRLLHKLQSDPINGVVPYVVHPEAVAKGERYLGTGPDARQIMDRYPGDPEGDPEEKAAYATLSWLRTVKPEVILDIHESNAQIRFISVGETSSSSALFSGLYLGYEQLVIGNAPFYRYAPNAVLLENSLVDEEPEMTANTLYQGIQSLAEVEVDGLQCSLEGKSFYRKIEIPTFTEGDELREGLEELEEIPAQPSFSPLEISDQQRSSLRIPRRAEVFFGTWGHENMSKLRPERFGYTANGVPRREWFGSIMVEIGPPKQTEDGYLIFENIL